MADKSEIPSVRSAIDPKDVIIKGTAGVAVFYLVNKFIVSEEYGWSEVIRAGLSSSVGLSVVAPIIDNILNNRDMTTGLNVDKNMFKNMVVQAGIGGGLYYILRMLFGTQVASEPLYKYASLIISVIGSDMISPLVLKKWA